jgi:hypothetical protein
LVQDWVWWPVRVESRLKTLKRWSRVGMGTLNLVEAVLE